MAPDHFTLERALTCLRDLGWRPGGIIDVGVGAGTPGLYSIWPGAPLCLIEPTPDAMVYMRQIAEKYPQARIFNCGASDRSGTLTARQPEGFRRVFFGRGKGYPELSLPVRTCDEMVDEAGLEAPILLKIDTDAHEREVLLGAQKTLERTEVVVIEANVFHPVRRMISPIEILGFLGERGFAFFDIAGFSIGKSGVMRAADFVLVKQDAPIFRTGYEHSGKSAEKRAKRVRQYQEFTEHNPLI
jgi:FkbM family methyltransferase